MRFLALLPLFAACSAELGDSQPTTVREHLERNAADLAVAPGASAGAVTASRHTSEGWVPGLADLKIETGSLVVSADADGVLAIEDVGLDVAPIEIPDTLLGYDVRLDDIHLGLAKPVKVVVTWNGDDEARGEAELEVSLSWSLVNHGTSSPLGSPELPPMPAELIVTGTGTNIHAELRVRAPGQLWTWAGLIELADLSLIISADSN